MLVAGIALAVLIVALVLSSPRDKRAERQSARLGPSEKGRSFAPAHKTPQTAVPAARTKEPAAARSVSGPRAAIVIDDLGQNLFHLEQLAQLDIPLSVAVIPGLPASVRTVELATRLGIEILLHQPMEPREETGKDAGAGVLLTSMDEAELRSRVRAGIAAVPGAVGVNNHMGSLFTENAAGVAALMAELREHDLFWLDSRTTAASLGVSSARAAGIPAIDRDVFLDAELDPDFIRGQVRKLVAIARRRGAAVGIGHPHPETIAVLRELRDELLASGVDLVPVSALVPRPPVDGSGPALAAAATDKRDGSGRAVPNAHLP